MLALFEVKFFSYFLDGGRIVGLQSFEPGCDHHICFGPGVMCCYKTIGCPVIICQMVVLPH